MNLVEQPGSEPRFRFYQASHSRADEPAWYWSWSKVACYQKPVGQKQPRMAIARMAIMDKSRSKTIENLREYSLCPFFLYEGGRAENIFKNIYIYLCPYVHTHHTHACAHVRARGPVRPSGQMVLR